MHSPSMLTPMVAGEVNSSRAEAALAHRRTRRHGPGRIGRLRARRSGAPPSLLPRGRTLPPLAH
jgi:hypothetical protein